MTTLRILAASLAATAALAGPARATDVDSMERRVQKYAAPNVPGRNKGVCVCQDGSALHGRAGLLLEQVATTPGGHTYVSATCNVQTYDATTGGLVGAQTCFVHVPLAK
jgi:hypothetical protein